MFVILLSSRIFDIKVSIVHIQFIGEYSDIFK